MILELETEKAVDCVSGLGIVSGYSQFRASIGILGLIGDLAFQLFHRLYPGGTVAWINIGIENRLGKTLCDHAKCHE